MLYLLYYDCEARIPRWKREKENIYCWLSQNNSWVQRSTYLPDTNAYRIFIGKYLGNVYYVITWDLMHISYSYILLTPMRIFIIVDFKFAAQFSTRNILLFFKLNFFHIVSRL